jgi:hypothetical protein
MSAKSAAGRRPRQQALIVQGEALRDSLTETARADECGDGGGPTLMTAEVLMPARIVGSASGNST